MRTLLFDARAYHIPQGRAELNAKLTRAQRPASSVQHCTFQSREIPEE